MEPNLSFDTCFLIDLERERTRSVSGPAHQLIETHSDSIFRLSVTALGEFGSGFPNHSHPVFQRITAAFELLTTDAETAWEYGRMFRDLKARGRLIGANDMWIAASALRHGSPLVTRNRAEFSQVPGLKVIEY
jgi:tRNA(fMet)-specific endonuclease VapC